MTAEMVALTVDGKEITVPKGTLVIRAAEQLGIEIPRFCEHPFLSPVGACRQCYVEIEGQRKLFTSCTTEVAPGMVVMTQNASEEARRAQVANLEFLLLNHPLDCPICDRGGECPLQDQTLAFGPGESRYVEPKRTYRKPLPLSPLINLDRERCVLCTRCTRFCDEISGDRFIELFERNAGERVSIAAGEDFRSPFSGNTVQICPVGALTSTSYRFSARPFDLSKANSVCGHCSAGCNVTLNARRGEVVRVLAGTRSRSTMPGSATRGDTRSAMPTCRRGSPRRSSASAGWSRRRSARSSTASPGGPSVPGWPSWPVAGCWTRTRTRSPSSRGWASEPTTSTIAGPSTGAAPRSWPRRRR
jgi:NADH-quinone oxidoreductase subunit G